MRQPAWMDRGDAWIKRQPWWLSIDLWLGRKAMEFEAKASYHRSRKGK